MGAALRRSFIQAATSPSLDLAVLPELALIDLSLRPRSGFKGRGTPEWLEAQGLVLSEPNRAARQGDGTLAVRLAPRELLLLAPWARPGGELIGRLDDAWPLGRDPSVPPRGYPVPRADSHFWFLLTGRHVPAMLAKLCGIDFRVDRFAPLQVAQTQAVRLSVIIIRDDVRPARVAPARRQRQRRLRLDVSGRRNAGVRREAGRTGRARRGSDRPKIVREQG